MQPRTQDGASGTQSIERAFAILREVKAATPESVTVAALADKVGLNRTTTHRIVSCLVEQGALRRDGDTGRIVLGPFANELGVGAPQTVDLKTAFAPVLTRIAEKTGDTVFLMLRSAHDSVCVDRRSGSYPVKTLVVEIGTRRPLGVGAASIAMLAQMEPAECQQIARDNARALKRYHVSADGLRKAVAFARASGYAATRVQAVEGVCALGVAFKNTTGDVIGAISMAAVATRMTSKRQVELKNIIAAELRSARDSLGL